MAAKRAGSLTPALLEALRIAHGPRPLQFRRAWVGRLAYAPRGARQPLVVDLVYPVGRGTAAWKAAMMKRLSNARIAKMNVPVVAPEDLVLFKLLVREDRGYDLADARSVLDVLGSSIDSRYLERHARALGVLGKLRAL